MNELLPTIVIAAAGFIKAGFWFGLFLYVRKVIRPKVMGKYGNSLQLRQRDRLPESQL